MIVRRIRLERFKRLAAFEAEFAPTVTVVKGPNESGKSTLVEAIVAGLLVSPASSAERARGLSSWGREARARVTLELEVDGQTAVVEKDFEARKLKIRIEGETITAVKKAQEWLGARLGCSTAELFLATACVQEEDVRLPDVGRNEAGSSQIVERLQAMLTGGPGGNPRQAISRLKKRHDEIGRKPNSANPEGGPAHSLRARTEDLERRIKKLRQDLAAADLAAADLDRIQQKRAALEAELTPLRTVIGSHRLSREAQKKKAELSEKLTRLTRAEELTKRRDEVDRLLAGSPGYERLEPEVARLRDLTAQASALEQKLQELSRRREDAPPAPPARTWLIAAGALLMAAGLGLVSFLAKAWPLLLLALGAASFGAGLLLGWRHRRAEAVRIQAIDAELEKEARRQDELSSARRELEARFGRAGTEACLAAYAESSRLRAEADWLARAIDDLRGPVPAAELGRAIAAGGLELRAETARIEELAPYRIDDPLRLARLEAELTRKEEETLELKDRQTRAETRAEAAGIDAEELAGLEEEKSELEGRLEYWERERRVLEKAHDALVEAVEAVLGKAGEAIEREVGPLLAAMTGGRYAEVRADNALNLAVFSAERGGFVGEDDLSLGAREQLHFAARLALVNLITDGRRPPLILDDPFAHFDDRRLAGALDLLKQLSRRHQVIVLAPTDRYDAIADRVIELEPPRQ